MRQFLQILTASLVYLACLTPAAAQDDDKGFLTRTIQDALSGAGRTVSIDGFAGALSSEASFDRMTIADDDGIWLTLDDVVLDWNRSALLRGRLEVEQLTAGRLDVERLPVSNEVDLPDAIDRLPKLGFFPGSTIGNMVPRTEVDLLRSMRATLGADEGASPLLLIGMDLIKDRAVLEAAYDDAAGVTAAFNLNLVTRINRELGGTMPADAFAHEARWNDDLARIEMHLVATRDVAFEVSGQRFAMEEGDTIHTENSHKFTPRTASLLLLAGGWTPLERWTDAKDQFSVLLARATDQREAP